MRLRYVELLHAVLATGSLTGAAELLNISQPAASKALQQAEQHLGFPLFSRVRGRLQPTQQTLLMRRRVDTIMQELLDLQRLTGNMRRPDVYALRVTCTPALAQLLVPDAVTELRGVFADTSAELYTQHSVEMCKSLVLRDMDIGLTLQAPDHRNLCHEALWQGQVVVIAPPGWWTQEELRRPLPVSELAGQPMVGIAMQDALGSMLHNHLAQLDPVPRMPVRVQTYQLAHALVAKGEGLALVDPFTARSGPEDAVQVRRLKLKLEVVLHAVYRNDQPLDAVQQRFLDIVRRLARRLGVT